MTDRRRFLTTAGSAVVYKLAGPKPRLKAADANGTISLGFIGSGIRGTQLIDDFKRTNGVKMLAACDLYDGCLARAKEQIDASVAVSKDYRTVLDRKDIDAVVIATPDHLHKKMVLDALAAGKHVYIEKPMTWNLDEGQAIINAEKSSGKIVQVGSQGKTSQLTVKMREIVASGGIGKVNMLRLSNHRSSAEGAWKYAVPPDASPETIDWDRFLGDRPKRPFDARVFFQWRCWWEFSGGVATDLFVHLLTWLHEVMNVKAPVSMASFGGIWKWNDGRNVPDVMNSIFEYKEGFLADMYVNLANTYPTRSTIVMGSEGTLVEERGRVIRYFEPVDHDVQNYGTLQWPATARAAYFEAKGRRPDGSAKEPLSAPKQPAEIAVPRGPSHADLFILSIRDSKPSVENAEEGHYAAGAAHVANLAYRTGKRMNWDAASGKVSEA